MVKMQYRHLCRHCEGRRVRSANIVGVVLGCSGYKVIDLGVMVDCDILKAVKRIRQTSSASVD